MKVARAARGARAERGSGGKDTLTVPSLRPTLVRDSSSPLLPPDCLVYSVL